jgi:hypothetical protein
MATWDDPSGTFSDQSGTWSSTGDLSGFGGYGGGSMWNPSNWFTSDQSGTFSDPTGTSGGSGSGGMNWAGLSQNLGKLSEALNKSGGASSDPMQGSKSVAPSTGATGSLQPAGGGGGASALASMLSSRNQLGQYLLLAAMQGKGRGKSGQGLLG